MGFDGNLTLRKSPIHRLNEILNYELSTSVIYMFMFFSSLFLPVVLLAIVLFTPYLLYVLFKERKFGWITAFFVLVILPYLIGILFLPSFSAAGMFSTMAMGLFYLYCFLLKMSTREWIAAENARNELEYKRKLKKVKDDIFNSQFTKN
jgi:hypothetical protein